MLEGAPGTKRNPVFGGSCFFGAAKNTTSPPTTSAAPAAMAIVEIVAEVEADESVS